MIFRKIRLLLEMIRFSHTIFALPFALLAALMAWSVDSPAGARAEFRWLQLVGIVICMVGARSAAMAFNRIVDRKIDAANPRTRGRHLPQASLSLGTVVLFTIASALLFVAGTLCFLPNVLPLILSVPVLAFLCGYSFTKRFTSLAHYWLGLALGLAPIAAWIAIRGEIVMAEGGDLLPAMGLAGAIAFWVGGFDILYACQDREFDAAVHLKSIPVRLGTRGALRLAAASHAVMVVWLALLPFTDRVGGPELGLGWIYALGLLAIAALLVYEHALVSADDLQRVNVAFFHVNALVSIGLAVIVAVDLYV